jgi:signal transduction histidine kinase
MFRSIRWRLVASYVLLTLLTVSLVGVLALSLVQKYVEQRVVADLRANAEAVARQAGPLMVPALQTAALNELVRTAAFLGNARVKILDARRQTLADSGSPTDSDQVMWLSLPTGLEFGRVSQPWVVVVTGEKAIGETFLPDKWFFPGPIPPDFELTIARRVAGVWGTRFSFEVQALERFPVQSPAESQAVTLQEAPRSERVVTVPIGAVDDPLGYVELGGGPDFSAEAVATTRRAFLLAGGGAVLLAVIVGLLVSHGLTSPLRRLTATADRMSADLSARAPVRSQDEIGQLARQLNLLAERLQTSFADLAAERDALRRFVADASHELRTPITALKSFNELLRGAADEDLEARAEFLAESAAQLERLEWITHNLLNLSRLDAGLVALELALCDVGEVIEAASAPFKLAAREKGVLLSVAPVRLPLELECDRARVELALSNLLDNALKFTPAGGRVEIGAEESQEYVRMWVRDSGPGIQPDDLPHVFERFYRGRSKIGDGNGLGLAIVHSIAQAHGGRAWAESQPGAGSRFVIELPA